MQTKSPNDLTNDELKDYLRDNISRQNEIATMRATTGWQHVREHINAIISVVTQKLLICDPDEVLRHQERIRAFSSVIELIEDENQLSANLQHELDQLIEQEQYDKLYVVNE